MRTQKNNRPVEIENPLQRKTTIKSPKTKKDQKELFQIIREKNKLDFVKAKLQEKKNEISECKDDIKKLFAKSNKKESELKSYIAELNSKMINTNVKYDDKIDDMHKSIMTMIAEIQEKVKMEINFTKKEMERDVIGKFTEAEQRHQLLLNKKMDEQKKVYEKMSNTKFEIEKIQKNFEQTNLESDGLWKENEILRITLQSLEEDNINLNKKLDVIKDEYVQLAKEHKKVFKNESFENPFNLSLENNEDEEKAESSSRHNSRLNNDSSSNLAPDIMEYENNENMEYKEYKEYTDDNVKSHRKSFLKNSLEFDMEESENVPNPDFVISSLKSNIKEVKNEYLNLHKSYLEEIKQRNESQQVIQKCIEDLKLEINKTTKDIINFTKLSANLSGGLFKKSQEQLIAKQNHLNSLENKIRVMTFIHDNGFQNTKMKKNKLLSSLSTFASTKYRK